MNISTKQLLCLLAVFFFIAGYLSMKSAATESSNSVDSVITFSNVPNVTASLPAGSIADSESVQWYALGDSITQGFYSYLAADEMATLGLDPQRCWAALVAESTGWELTNYGVGGSGYVHEGTVLNKLNARDHVDTIDFSRADLVTLAYGVNDWKYDMPLGTMEDIFQAELEICEYYGIPLIDMLHGSTTVTTADAPEVLPDGVHPSLKCHAELALELAQEIAAALEE